MPQNFMGNDPKGAQLINRYLEERDRTSSAGPSRGQSGTCPASRPGVARARICDSDSTRHAGSQTRSSQPAPAARQREQHTPVAPLQPHQAPNLGEGWRVYRKDEDTDNQYATSSSKAKSRNRPSRPSSTQDLAALEADACAGQPSTSTQQVGWPSRPCQHNSHINAAIVAKSAQHPCSPPPLLQSSLLSKQNTRAPGMGGTVFVFGQIY